MILKLLISIALLIVRILLGIIIFLTPEISGQEIIQTTLLGFTNFLDASKNFLYFIIGQPFYFIIDSLIIYLTFKLIIYPVILLIRRNITKTE